MSGSIFLFSLQIQCILQDVGSNIATPRSSARESHISMDMLASVMKFNCYFTVSCVLKDFLFALSYVFERENRIYSSANYRLGNLD